eukprot:TRINITY_DN5735_c0_g1_i1.p1 TRINITY_DN5735_c0_g1~~TRINITY_DN5735_c0_g1_i1.p1  ORF type:complete len:2253 (+),score=776.62 TRINITY_DN5735_c0_g1_i1:407-6760(+)
MLVDEASKRVEEEEMLLRDPKNGEFEKTRTDMLEAAQELAERGEDLFTMLHKIVSSQQFLQKYFQRRSSGCQTAISIAPEHDVAGIEEISCGGKVNDLFMDSIGLQNRNGIITQTPAQPALGGAPPVTTKFNADPKAGPQGEELVNLQIQTLRERVLRDHELIVHMKEQRDCVEAQYRLNMSLKGAEIQFLRVKLNTTRAQMDELTRGEGFTTYWQPNGEGGDDVHQKNVLDMFEAIRKDVLKKNDVARRHAQELAEQNKQLEKEKSKASDENKAFQQRLATLAKERESDVAARDHQIADLEQVVTDRDSSLRRMQLESSIAKDRVAQLSEQLAETQSDHRVFHEQIDALKSQLAEAIPPEMHHNKVTALQAEKRKAVVLEKFKRAMLLTRVANMQKEMANIEEKSRQETQKADMKLQAFGNELANANAGTAKVFSQFVDQISDEAANLARMRHAVFESGPDEVFTMIWEDTRGRLLSLRNQVGDVAATSAQANAFAAALGQASTQLKDELALKEPKRPDSVTGLSLLREEMDALTQSLENTQRELADVRERSRVAEIEAVYAKQLCEYTAQGVQNVLDDKINAMELTRTSFGPIPADVTHREAWAELDRSAATGVGDLQRFVTDMKKELKLWEGSSADAVSTARSAFRADMERVYTQAGNVSEGVLERLRSVERSTRQRMEGIVGELRARTSNAQLEPHESQLLENYQSYRKNLIKHNIRTVLARASRRAGQRGYLKRIIQCIQLVSQDDSFASNVQANRLLHQRECNLLFQQLEAEVDRLENTAANITENLELFQQIEAMNSKYAASAPTLPSFALSGLGGDPRSPAESHNASLSPGASPELIPVSPSNSHSLVAAASPPKKTPRGRSASRVHGLTHKKSERSLSRMASDREGLTTGHRKHHDHNDSHAKLGGGKARKRAFSINPNHAPPPDAPQEELLEQQNQRVRKYQTEILSLEDQLQSHAVELLAAKDTCADLGRELADVKDELAEARRALDRKPSTEGSDVSVVIRTGVDAPEEWPTPLIAPEPVVEDPPPPSRRETLQLPPVVAATESVLVQTEGAVLCDAATVMTPRGAASAGRHRLSASKSMRKGSGLSRKSSKTAKGSRPGTGRQQDDDDAGSPLSGSFLFTPWDDGAAEEGGFTALTLRGHRDREGAKDSKDGEGASDAMLGGSSPLPTTFEQGTVTEPMKRKSSTAPRPPRADSLKAVIFPAVTCTGAVQTEDDDAPLPQSSVPRESRATSVPNFHEAGAAPGEPPGDAPDPDPDATCKYCGTQFQQYPYCPFTGVLHHWHQHPEVVDGDAGKESAVASSAAAAAPWPGSTRKAREQLTGSWGASAEQRTESPDASPTSRFGLASTTTPNLVERVDISDGNAVQRAEATQVVCIPRPLPPSLGRKLSVHDRGAPRLLEEVGSGTPEYPYSQYVMSPSKNAVATANAAAASPRSITGWAVPQGYQYAAASPQASQQASATPMSQRPASVLRQRPAGEWTSGPDPIYHEAKETNKKLLQTAKLLDLSLRANQRLNRTVGELQQQQQQQQLQRPAGDPQPEPLPPDYDPPAPDALPVDVTSSATARETSPDSICLRIACPPPAHGDAADMPLEVMAAPALPAPAPGVDQVAQTEPVLLENCVRDHAVVQCAPNRFLSSLRTQSEYLYLRMKKFLDAVIADEFQVSGAPAPAALALLPSRAAAIPPPAAKPPAPLMGSRVGSAASRTLISRPGTASAPSPLPAIKAPPPPPLPEVPALVHAPGVESVIIAEADLDRPSDRQPTVPSVRVTLSRPGSSAGAPAPLGAVPLPEGVAESVRREDEGLEGLSVEDFKRLEESWRRDAAARWFQMRDDRERAMQREYQELKRREAEQERAKREYERGASARRRAEPVQPVVLAPMAKPTDAGQGAVYDRVVKYLMKRSDEMYEADPVEADLMVMNGFNGESLDTLQAVTTDARIDNYDKVRELRRQNLTLDAPPQPEAQASQAHANAMPCLKKPGMAPSVLLHKQRRGASSAARGKDAWKGRSRSQKGDSHTTGSQSGNLAALPLSRPGTGARADAPPSVKDALLQGPTRRKHDAQLLRKEGTQRKERPGPASTLPPAPSASAIAGAMKVESRTVSARPPRKM